MDQYTRQALVELGLAGPEIDQIRRLTFEAATKAVEELKVNVKRRGRVLLGKYHPDRNPGDEKAEAMFKAINNVLQKVETLQVRRPPPRPRFYVTVYPAQHSYGGTVTSTSTYSTVSFRQEPRTTVTYDASKAVRIKP